MKKTIILGYHEGTPIIQAEPVKGKELQSFYCEHCKRRHTHTLANGHRCAHCYSIDSPFSKTGYYLNSVER